MLKSSLYLALIHSPVLNRKGETVSAALTTIDLHDIARAAYTFGADGFYVVTPFADQQALAKKVIAHWIHGEGGKLNPHRKDALGLIKVETSFEDMCVRIGEKWQGDVVTVATSAKSSRDNLLPVADFREMLNREASYVINFGTAWGLAEEFIEGCDFVLEPIQGTGAYNHLSVRSAVSIYLDRICNL